MTIQISIRNPQDDEMIAILQTHLAFCMASTPIEHVHALDVSKLTTPDVTVFGAQLNGDLVGVGALRILESDHAELKSMHTISKARGQGVGRALVEHISNFAIDKGLSRLSLETGTGENFKAARALYTSMGFEPCEAFGDYENTQDNLCMSKRLWL